MVLMEPLVLPLALPQSQVLLEPMEPLAPRVPMLSSMERTGPRAWQLQEFRIQAPTVLPERTPLPWPMVLPVSPVLPEPTVLTGMLWARTARTVRTARMVLMEPIPETMEPTALAAPPTPSQVQQVRRVAMPLTVKQDLREV